LPPTAAADTIPDMTRNQWLRDALVGRPALDPGVALRQLEDELRQLEGSGDSESVARVSGEIDALIEQARQRQREEAEETRRAFSSGVRTPVQRVRPQGERMDEMLLIASGREPRRRRF